MPRFVLAALAATALSGTATAASAQVEPRWFVHVGAALVMVDEKAEMEADGVLVPGADVSIDSEQTIAFEIGRFLTPNIAVAFAGGFPPNFEVESAGTLAFLGRDGELRGGPAALTMQYHANQAGRFRPYVGAGLAMLYVFDTKDGAVTNVEVDNAFGPVVQAGAAYDFGGAWGVFADFKKSWITTEARGNLGPSKIRADIRLDPSVVSAGLQRRF